MQHTEFTRKQRRKYHKFLQSDHDFRVWVDVLTMEEKHVSRLDLLDGQVNLIPEGPIKRTSSVVLSDPEGALRYGGGYTYDDKGELWFNRILRVSHQVDVPGLGEVVSIPFVGVPTGMGHEGAEVSLEMVDKTYLALIGVAERCFPRGMNAAEALRLILLSVGEEHIRIPPSRRVLSRPYTIGMHPDIFPWHVAERLAERELHWDLFYAADGFATARPARSNRARMDYDDVLSLPSSSVSYSEFSNFVKVVSHRMVKKKRVTKTGRAQIPNTSRLSPKNLGRNGVPRRLPVLVSDNNLTTRKAVDKRADNVLREVSHIGLDQSYELIPAFHLDNGDILKLPYGIDRVKFSVASIPLTCTGNMTVGHNKWVSKPVKSRKRRKPARGGRQRD